MIRASFFPSTTKGPPVTHVWYAAYGSNLHARRLAYYIEGGTPPGTGHTYPGFRDRTPPLKTTPLTLPGSIYFAWQSPVWTGGVAFYADRPQDSWVKGAAARGYLLTYQQFSDLATQEMYRIPGETPDLDVEEIVANGKLQIGPGRYETLVHVNDVDGFPVVTFTSPWDTATVQIQKPSARYLGMLAAGLYESHKWEVSVILTYLSKLPGVEGRWDPEELHALVEAAAQMP
ncbi:histone deacetylase (plasmid) [Nocardia asteroides]|nr:histone deacetylase [Nocardia asteroides]